MLPLRPDSPREPIGLSKVLGRVFKEILLLILTFIFVIFVGSALSLF